VEILQLHVLTRLPAGHRLATELVPSQSHIATDGQSVSKYWCRAPDYYCLTVTVLFLWGALSNERAGLSFVYDAGPCQRSLSRVRVLLGLTIIFYCLRFETSLFVASYDSQGHGKGIGPRLHTSVNSFIQIVVIITYRHGPHRKHSFSIVVVQLLQLPSNGNVFIQPLTRKGVVYSSILWSLHSNGCIHYSMNYRYRRSRNYFTMMK
jgi:hypothetical protein